MTSEGEYLLKDFSPQVAEKGKKRKKLSERKESEKEASKQEKWLQ